MIGSTDQISIKSYNSKNWSHYNGLIYTESAVVKLSNYDKFKNILKFMKTQSELRCNLIFGAVFG